MKSGITPNLWFDKEAEEAAHFYASVFPNSKVGNITGIPTPVRKSPAACPARC